MSIRNKYPAIKSSSSDLESMHQWAAEEANRTGEKVHCNGVNYVPNKPRDVLADIGIALLYIGFGVAVIVIFLGFLVVVLS